MRNILNKKTYQFFWILIILSVINVNTFVTEEQEKNSDENEVASNEEYIHEWVAKIPGGQIAADSVASELGFINNGKVSLRIHKCLHVYFLSNFGKGWEF